MRLLSSDHETRDGGTTTVKAIHTPCYHDFRSTASFISLMMHFNIEIYRGRLSICVCQSTKPGHEMELTRRPKSFICRLIKVTAIKRQLSLSGSPTLALIAILRAKKSPMLHDGEGRTEDDSIDSNYLDLLHEFGAFLISVHFTVLRL